tara:strand:- start:704 stop:823 length:120 start_codon:yes stop_codon:yes gene_type:complete
MDRALHDIAQAEQTTLIDQFPSEIQKFLAVEMLVDVTTE